MLPIRYTRNLFLRAMCVVYLFSFISFYIQIPGMYLFLYQCCNLIYILNQFKLLSMTFVMVAQYICFQGSTVIMGYYQHDQFWKITNISLGLPEFIINLHFYGQLLIWNWTHNMHQMYQLCSELFLLLQGQFSSQICPKYMQIIGISDQSY